MISIRLLVPGAVATLLLVAGAARAADDVMTPEHVAKLRGVTSAVISPDGEHVAYTLSVPRTPFEDDNGGAYSELHIADVQGDSRPFITGKVSIRSLKWMPNGREISFLTKREGDEQTSLYVIATDGGEARKLLEHETGISSYAWSPDGTRVAFLATEKKDDKEEKLKKKGFNAEIYEEQLLFTRVWIAEPGNDDWKPRVLELDGNAAELHWSPAGSQLAVALAPTPLVDDSYMSKTMHIVDVASGAISASFDTVGKMGPVTFSPDGRHLAMIGTENINDPKDGRLMVGKTSGGKMTDLLPGLKGHVTSILWQDRDTLVFLCDQGTMTSLERIDVTGKNRKAIIPAGKMVLGNLSLSKDGEMAAAISDAPTHAPEVLAIRLSKGEPKRLTDSNPWLGKLRLAEQQVVRHKARDGLELEGILIRPLDEEEGKRYPLILCVHGGPEAHIQNGWLTRYSYGGQVAAARGFAVFYPNYRGSTGRGVEFSRMGQADYGGKEFDDLIDAVDHLIDTGLVDRDRVGITGGSYGGFATAWCSTKHTERFAAGVMFVGISDQISKSGSTDIPNEMFHVHALKRPWDDWQFFLERSPIYYVEQARTPLLIMHGKDDPRVHPSQSLELYRQLKVIGETPVRLVYYPGEGHGNRKAAARYDYNLRMLRWFEHYLQGAGGAPPDHPLEYPLEKKEEKQEASG